MFERVEVARHEGAASEAGDWPPGFVRLYFEEYAAMVRTARLMVGRTDVAEELVQDCFIRVAERWEHVDKPGAYLRRSVVNAARGHLRRRSVERFYGRRRERQVVGPPEVHGLWEALERLTPRRRIAVVLRFWEDLDDDEIAQVLDCKPVTVRSLVHRALRQLEEVVS